MPCTPSDRRKLGIRTVKERFGNVSELCISVSRFYPDDKSWSGTPVWFFDLPLKRLEGKTCSDVFLVCQQESSSDFHILKVPASYFMKNLKGLSVSGEERVRIYLSAESKDWLVELRGNGRVRFDQFQV